MTAFIDVVSPRDPGWDKDAAVRASETAQLLELVSRLVGDLAHLDSPRHPRLDYLDPAALDSVRGDPDSYQLIGRAASSLEDAGERCTTTAYWSDPDQGEVDVELELNQDTVVWGPALAPLRGAPASHHLLATVDRRQGRIEKLELG